MNIVFFGTSEFAMPVLRRLIGSKHKVLAVVTQPDRQKGRRLKISPPPTKVLAEANNIPVYQPLDASGRDSIDYLKNLKADLFVVAAFGQILKKEALAIPKIYALNVHGSILPKYRGAAPTNYAIMNGDKTSGVTIIKMNEKMDEGGIIFKKEIPIDAEDTNITLSEKLSDLGAMSLMEAMDLIEAGKADLTPQEDSRATHAPKLKKADGLIDWNEPAGRIHNKVRALLPWPSAYTYFGGKILKILKAEAAEPCTVPQGGTGARVKGRNGKAKNGEIIAMPKHEGIVVKTGDGNLLIKYVQIEGKRPFDTDALLCGHKITPGYIFGKSQTQISQNPK